MNKLIEDIVICVTIALGLTISFFFLYASVANGQEYPPTAIGAFFGLAVAALTYRFLGGTSTTEVKFGVLKLTGSAALLMGCTYFLGEWIAKERNLFADSQSYRQEIAALEGDLKGSREDVEKKNQRIADLQREARNAPGARGSLTLTEIKQLQPSDSFIRDLKHMVATKQGPFREVIREAQLAVVVVQIPGETYNICEGRFNELYEGVPVPNTKLRIARSAGEDVSEEAVVAERRGFIGSDVCKAPSRDFDIQISCPIALKLFHDKISDCAEARSIRGTKVTVGSLPD